MSNVGRWETVVSSRTKKSGSSLPMKAADKRRAVGAAMDHMPKIEDLVALQPVKESPTLFGALSNVKEGKKNKAQSDESATSKSSPRADTAAKRKDKPSRSSRPQTLGAAMKTLTLESLEKALNQSRRAFPNATLLWLKDMASFLNVHFEDVAFDDPFHANQRADFPSSELPAGVKRLVIKTMQSTTSNVLEIFFYHCVQSMVTDLSKGLSIYGYQIVAQLLAYMSPSNVLGDSSKYAELLTENQARPLRCLAVLWAMGQCGHKDLATGIRVFFDTFPFVSSRHLAPHILGYLDLILNVHVKHLHMGSKSLGLAGYFMIMDFFNQSQPTALTSMEMKKLNKSIVPKLRLMAYGADPGNTLHAYFPSYLNRLDTMGPMKGEYLSSLVTCLVRDPACFSVWRELYVGHLPQSGILLKHLAECQGTKTADKIDQAKLKETIKSFRVTNEELRAASSKSTPAGLELCEDNCRPLLAKTELAIERNSAVGRGKVWLKRFFILISSLLVLDVVLHWEDGQEAFIFRLLRGAGFSSQLDQVLVNVGQLWIGIRRWISVDSPVLYEKAVVFLGPFGESLRNALVALFLLIGEFLIYLYESGLALTTWALDALETHFPGWSEKTAATTSLLIAHALRVATMISEHALELWAMCVEYAVKAATALRENELSSSLWTSFVGFLDVSYQHVSRFVEWLVQWFQLNISTMDFTSK